MDKAKKDGVGYARCSTYEVKIYCGLRVGYGDTVMDEGAARLICREFANARKTCVSVTCTAFEYPGGDEPGIIVGFINYPRFPKKEDHIRDDAYELARLLMVGLKQFRVSIVTPECTTTLSNHALLDEMGEPRE